MCPQRIISGAKLCQFILLSVILNVDDLVQMESITFFYVFLFVISNL